MPLKAIKLRPGVSKENTRYTTEQGWFDCDKVRFRMGTPEKVGGWKRISNRSFLGVCRSLWNWVTLNNQNLIAVGTNLKFYIERGGRYNDITPVRTTRILGNNPFAANGTTIVTVNDPLHGAFDGDFVTFSGATGTFANILTGEFQIAVLSANQYTITVPVPLVAGNYGGATVSAAYQVNTGPEVVVPLTGWGAGAWGSGAWGLGNPSADAIRIWSQSNFGEDLIFGPRGGAIYYWDATNGVNTRGVFLSSLPMASDVPVTQNFIFISDINRFVFAMGANDLGTTVRDPMLIRWSDQESAVNWTPAATNQAGSLRLSRGSEIVAAIQTRQEVVVFTDFAVYSLQYQGAPIVWGAQLLGDNTSIISPNAVAIASGVVFWMGVDKFYTYDGRVQTLPCDLRRHVFGNINTTQLAQVYAGTNEGFNEVWWFYPSANSMQNDRYVVYNYLEKVWYHGTLGRTAWLDSGLKDFPIGATYSNNLVEHENGVDDFQDEMPVAINAYIESSEFDIEDGHNFGFVWRVLPDVTFDGSVSEHPAATMTLIPMKGSGSGFTTPQSVAGTSSAPITRTATVPIEQFTNQVNIRVRGRQMILKMQSTDLGVMWQMGTPRLDVRVDGRK
jgi:hypothetical protein